MGISKSWTDPNTGVEGNHWHITAITYNEEYMPIPMVQCMIKLWKDEQSCRERKQPIHTEMVVLTQQAFDNYVAEVNGTGAQPGEFKVALYEYVMTLQDKPWYGGVIGPDVYGVLE